jgi:hypothetical protein
VGNAWNADVTQNGAAVTATNASYNGVIAAGGSQSFGLTGSWKRQRREPDELRPQRIELRDRLIKVRRRAGRQQGAL